ncbi:MAG: hypothetical protein L3J56_14260 [Bacteroidales bacterium]|nr:hypothetical protein [Bacteroidales bacterium]
MDCNFDKVFITSEIELITDTEIKEIADNLVSEYIEISEGITCCKLI